MHPSPAARRAALFTIPTGVLAATVAFSGTASAATISDPGAAAGRFLSTQLAADGDRFQTSYGGESYTDYGLTLDAILGLAASGSSGAQAARSTTYIADHVTEYIGAGTELYSGATAKTLLTAAVEKRNVTSFGGVNLVTSMKSLEQASGRFSDKSAYGDYSNAIGQSLAILGLKRAGSAPSVNSVAYLAKQQCADGGIRLTLDDKTCTSDPDVTAFAVQAFVAGGGQSAALSKAVAYLKGKQGADGGVGGSGPTAGENSNSTGLAAAAFTAAGATSSAAKAESYLRALQYGCSFPAALRGAIAYNADALAAAKAKGAKAAVADQDRRSTAQAILGVTGTSYATVTSSGSSATPADQCTTSPTTSPTTTPTSGTATSTGGTSSSVTGPPVITDGADTDSSSVVAGFALAIGGGAALGAGGLAVARRRQGRHSR